MKIKNINVYVTTNSAEEDKENCEFPVLFQLLRVRLIKNIKKHGFQKFTISIPCIFFFRTYFYFKVRISTFHWAYFKI